EVAEKSGCPRAVLMQRAAEINWGDFSGVNRLGITAGASAPEVLVEEIMGAFAERYILDIETVTATEEGVFFPLPRPLREHEAAERRFMAVSTDVPAGDLTRFLSGYDIGELLSYKGIAEGVENSNFLVHTGTGNFILTLYEKRVAEGDLPFFLGLMEHLAARGITSPQPVKNKRGGVLGKIAGRPAAIVTFLDGLWIRRPSPGHCAAVGDALARLHLAGGDFRPKRANALSIESW